MLQDWHLMEVKTFLLPGLSVDRSMGLFSWLVDQLASPLTGLGWLGNWLVSWWLVSLDHIPPTPLTQSPLFPSTTPTSSPHPIPYSPLNDIPTAPLTQSPLFPLNHIAPAPLTQSPLFPLNHIATAPLTQSPLFPLNHIPPAPLAQSPLLPSTTHYLFLSPIPLHPILPHLLICTFPLLITSVPDCDGVAGDPFEGRSPQCL